MKALVVALAVLTVTGCSLNTKTISHSAAVGTTLRGGVGGLKITPTNYHPMISAGHDGSGLDVPAAGTHFASLVIRECITSLYLPTIGQSNYSLGLAGGGQAQLKGAETRFADDLDLLGEPGCEQGHIVFQVPAGRTPSALTFALDVTNTTSNGEDDSHTKVRLTWTLGAG
jgi:hypothetical protein